jgi:glucose-1-phosphate cytidylyltransferase
MKVVLFCGGLGLRLREYSQSIPKPMARIGYQPILWYVMKYFAHYGHNDFILCLGYRGDAIKEYFLNYNEAMSNDFTIADGGTELHLYNSDIHDWRITFVDTGLDANIGMRLSRVRSHLEGEEMFLANYSDGLTDLPFDNYMEFVQKQDKVATFMSVEPTAAFHAVQADKSGLVQDIKPISRTVRINCGYFAFKQEIFDFLKEGEELVIEPFHRLIKEKQLATYQYDGFWKCMDTFKDKQEFDDLYARGHTPWTVWKK